MKRVLVANRGEIAARIMRTVQDLGLEGIAVFSDADRDSPHINMAHEAIALGGATPAESYLQIDRIIEIALQTGAEGIHPGYGLLSESATFAAACEEHDIAFIGPTPTQLEVFGKKHTAREIAADAGVPLVPGSKLLASAKEALEAAGAIGYPIILKASAGGGGIGMRRCNSASELNEAYDNVRHLAAGNFGDASVFLEKFVENARHIEVQIFGDGKGEVIALGERDCSAQRRNQKVIEETPAAGVSAVLRKRLLDYSTKLCRSVNYRSAGTVEFVVDADSLNAPDGGNAWFLEVNTRLQVEHGVTELTHGIDIVEWMLKLAAGAFLDAFKTPPQAEGYAIQARLYAEDPGDNFAPSPGLITEFSVPDHIRCDTWVRAGTEVSPYYDPLIAKLMVYAKTREGARASLVDALQNTHVSGIETNRALLVDLLSSNDFRNGTTTTNTIAQTQHTPPTIKVLDGGLFTTIQDLPGRLGYWHVGVPPSGPMDEPSLRKINELLGNDSGAPALEITLTGPTLKFTTAIRFAIGGASLPATLDGHPIDQWTVVEAQPGSVLDTGTSQGPGARSILGVAGGFNVPKHLGSTSTFVLGGFGGHAGRTLRTGDVLKVIQPEVLPETGTTYPVEQRPELSNDWVIEVLPGPHAAPDYFLPSDIEMLYSDWWEVHFNSDRTGIRLIGPKPDWARTDGGEAGLHPSNIHDNAYSVGAIDFTGDMPIVLGKDGPSLGGFVCPATIAEDEFWKIGQARAGDRVRFVSRHPTTPDPVLKRIAATESRPDFTVRRSGDSHLLVEYGENVLDIALRIRVGALMSALEAMQNSAITELVPGIRSLQVGFDPTKATTETLVTLLNELDDKLPEVADLELPSRIVRLPLSWDDPATRLATEKYMQTVRQDAPWCPWNIEFIRRINGLETVEDVKRIVFDASYLVLGLGDVYLGAPVATPIDPRHRLVTTKYNPARTWTAENSVGIGGAYMCIYGMEGPGGYQFIGRTLPIWDRWDRGKGRGFEKPWLLRFFDQIQWYPVSAEELLHLRGEVNAGRFQFDIEETKFSVSDYLNMLETEKDSIKAFEHNRTTAFNAERERWAAHGIEINPEADLATEPADVIKLEPHQNTVNAPIPGVVWKLCTSEGEKVSENSTAVILESMKMETTVEFPKNGQILKVLCQEGQQVQAGEVLMIMES